MLGVGGQTEVNPTLRRLCCLNPAASDLCLSSDLPTSCFTRQPSAAKHNRPCCQESSRKIPRRAAGNFSTAPWCVATVAFINVLRRAAPEPLVNLLGPGTLVQNSIYLLNEQ